MEITKEVLNVLQEVKPGFDFTGQTNWVDSGSLDSFDVIQIVAELNEALDIDIPVEAIIPENFNSLETVENLVKSLLEDE